MEEININQIPEIRRVRRSGIDVFKWDSVIDSASNAKVYSSSWYLDITAGYWEALIMGDYEYVMPLPAKCRFGISYVYTPYYTQQLGIFPRAGKGVQAAFAAKLSRLYRHIMVQVDGSVAEDAFAGYRITIRHNRLLDLGNEYRHIRAGYKVKTRNVINKAEKFGLAVAVFTEPETADIFMSAYKPHYSGGKALEVLARLIRYTLDNGQGTLYMAFSRDSELLGGAFIVEHRYRAYYLSSFSTPTGKKLGASYAILNEFFRKKSGAQYIFDFEGSEIPGIDAFFRGFGAVIENYYSLEYSRLPGLILRLKRKLTRR